MANGDTSVSKVLTWATVLIVMVILFYLVGCYSVRKDEDTDGVALILDWNRYVLRAETHTEGYRGPVAARAYGYIGLAAYEAALPGLPGDFISFSTCFPGLSLPGKPNEGKFDVLIALNECYSTLLDKLYLTAPDPARRELKSISAKWEETITGQVDSSAIRISKAFGRDVANAVYAWSATDSLGYRANHHNYDRNYIPPAGEGTWMTSIDFPMPPLLPFWGKVRPFIILTENYLARPLPLYSIQTNQPYYIQALEIVSLSKPLSAENQWISDFWNDDHPGLTFTPPGHWLAITNQVIQKDHPPIEKTLETYLKVGFALSDAMIAAWYSKYFYDRERPETFIQDHIDSTWRPYAPSPSFPSYPSGHSMMGAAAAEVLTTLYGEGYKMSDNSHKGLEHFPMKSRTFNSFHDMARENALSRIIMGVHWRMDAEEGLRLGSLIGKEVTRIEIERKLTQ